MSVSAAIDRVTATIHLSPVDAGRDSRWQAIMDLSEYIHTEPQTIWTFLKELQDTKGEDLQAALATCLLDHPLEEHPECRIRAEH